MRSELKDRASRALDRLPLADRDELEAKAQRIRDIALRAELRALDRLHAGQFSGAERRLATGHVLEPVPTPILY